MALKKALVMLDFLIQYETKMHNAMSDPSKSWNTGSDNIRNLAKTLSDCHNCNLRVLNIIKKELVIKCKHPKKMQDVDSNGNRYCMNCNWDL